MAAPAPECHICLEELRRELVAAPCGHVFHGACALQALQVRAQCPICRRRARDADLVSLFLELPAALGDAGSPRATSQHEPPAEGETRKLSARVNALMERVQWQKKQSEVLLAEMERLRTQNDALVRDKQALAQRAAGLESVKMELLGKVGKYQLELSRQAEASRRMAVNQSIANFLDTCDADALEEEIQNPRELIVALKKACKFRHEQYQKVVKDKARLKAMLDVQQGGAPAQRQQISAGKGKSRSSAGYETKRPNPMDYAVGAPSPHFGAFPVESKKRKIDAVASAMNSLDSAPYMQAQQMANTGMFTARAESAGYRANAYSDVPVRPVTAARQTFGRSSYNPNQYGAYQLTPASDAPVGVAVPGDQAVCRRGYDETGKLTNFFLPKQPGMPSHAATATAGGLSTGGVRQKVAPSMRNLLNDDNYAPTIMSNRVSRGSDRDEYPADRREYTLTSWLRRG